MIDEEHLREMSNNLNQLSNNHERLDGLVRRFILLCRRDIVAIAAGAPGTQQKREELQEVTWKAIAQAVEYSKSEEAAQNAFAYRKTSQCRSICARRFMITSSKEAALSGKEVALCELSIMHTCSWAIWRCFSSFLIRRRTASS
jgi:hypothetical protein